MTLALYLIAAALTALEFWLRNLWPKSGGEWVAFVAIVALWPAVWAYMLYQAVRMVARQASEDFRG